MKEAIDMLYVQSNFKTVYQFSKAEKKFSIEHALYSEDRKIIEIESFSSTHIIVYKRMVFNGMGNSNVRIRYFEASFMMDKSCISCSIYLICTIF